jgi:acyl-coenzyme A synthetase/AMP-(fatty) acid ligase
LLNDETVPVLDRERLRFARSASAPLPPEIHRQFEKRFSLPIIETMGLTETWRTNSVKPITTQNSQNWLARHWLRQ